MPTHKIVGVFLTMGLFGLIGKVKALEVGSPAPDITALDENGAKFRFADAYAKGPALVFFYPKADTPGCTAQACVRGQELILDISARVKCQFCVL
jgi:peroxiredoxin Q/BCP